MARAMFTDMKHGTAEDWAHIAREHGRHQASVAPRQIMESLRRLEEIEVGFAANQLTHSLMAGTLARRSGASDEEVVAALCHDIGKLFSILNHGPIAAEMLKPYCRTTSTRRSTGTRISRASITMSIWGRTPRRGTV